MAGIYIHIPFCRKACHYCNFHFSTSFSTRDEMIRAIRKEMQLRIGYLADEPIDTIYFGGGTPSALPAEDIALLLGTVSNHYPVVAEAEVTLEANPDDLHTENLHRWRQAGINRLSIGIQAFQDHLLVKWNRSHTGRQANQAIQDARAAGFDNITCDLIYGDPDLNDAEWVSNIETLVNSGIPHISSYALTVEDRTALAHQIRKGTAQPPDDMHSSRQYDILRQVLAKSGFDQYEVSNFAKPGYVSRHNSRYWSGDPYLGIGPSAHSYNRKSRQWNIANNSRYIQALEVGTIPCEQEVLTSRDMYNEVVMTGLRTMWGIDLTRIRQLGDSYETYLRQQVKSFVEEKKMIRTADDRIRLDPSYYFFADGIASALFFL